MRKIFIFVECKNYSVTCLARVQRPPLFNIVLGSNHFIEAKGLISVKDNEHLKEIFKIELIPFRDTWKPLIDVEIRDAEGTHLGKAYRSTSFVHCHPDYKQVIEREEGQVSRLALKKRADDTYVFDMKLHAPNDVEINGVFYAEGIDYPIIATPEYLDINTNKFIRGIIKKKGAGIILTKNSISI